MTSGNSFSDVAPRFAFWLCNHGISLIIGMSYAKCRFSFAGCKRARSEAIGLYCAEIQDVALSSCHFVIKLGTLAQRRNETGQNLLAPGENPCTIVVHRLFRGC